jgi:hypothetical protein
VPKTGFLKTFGTEIKRFANLKSNKKFMPIFDLDLKKNEKNIYVTHTFLLIFRM